MFKHHYTEYQNTKVAFKETGLPTGETIFTKRLSTGLKNILSAEQKNLGNDC